MLIRFRCLCGKILKVDQRHARKRVRCPSCGAVGRVPDLADTPQQRPVAESATLSERLGLTEKGNCDIDFCGASAVSGKTVGPDAMREMLRAGGNPIPPREALLEASIALGIQCDWRLDWLRTRAETDQTCWFLCEECIARLLDVWRLAGTEGPHLPRPACHVCRQAIKPTAEGTPDEQSLAAYYAVLMATSSELGSLVHAAESFAGFPDAKATFLGQQPKFCPHCRRLWCPSCLGDAIMKPYKRIFAKRPGTDRISGLFDPLDPALARAFVEAGIKMREARTCPRCDSELHVGTNRWWNSLTHRQRKAASKKGRYR